VTRVLESSPFLSVVRFPPFVSQGNLRTLVLPFRNDHDQRRGSIAVSPLT